MMPQRFVTRAEWGALPPNGRTPETDPTGERLGVTVHWIGAPCSQPEHDSCAALVRSVQRTHQAGNGWSDIAYSFIVCQHGRVFVGRGWRWDQFANGETTNRELLPYTAWVTVLLLVGGNEDGTAPKDQHPTPAAKHALRRVVMHARRRGAGNRVVPHYSFHPKACPGRVLGTLAHRWDKAAELVLAGDHKPAPAAPTHPPRQSPAPPQREVIRARKGSSLWRALRTIAREWKDYKL